MEGEIPLLSTSANSLKLAAAELKRNPLRTLLVSQGVLWAVALMVLPAAVLLGSRRNAIDQAREMGTDRIQLEGAPSALPAERPQQEDLQPLRQFLPRASISGLRVEPLAIVSGPPGYLVGGDLQEPRSRNLTLERGRWYRPASENREVVIEAGLVGDLFGSEDPLGQKLILNRRGDGSMTVVGENQNGLSFSVVGVLGETAEESSDLYGIGKNRIFSDLVRNLLKALGMLPSRVPWIEDGRSIHLPRGELPGSHLDWIAISTDPGRIEEISAEVEAFLVERGRRPVLYSNIAWSVLSRSELDSYLLIHDVFFWVTAVLGLLVLANLLLLSGQRRQREVALRRCEGAMRRDIFLQFFWEGILLALVGTVLGTLMGMLIATIRAELDPSALITVDWPWSAIARAGVLVLLGSTVASIGPAWAASGAAPVLLLRRGH